MVITDIGVIEKVIPGNNYGFANWNEYYQSATNAYWSSTASTGGTNDANLTAAVIAGHPGVCRMSSGTSATGSASLRTNSGNHILGNSWVFRYDAIIKLIKLSDATDTFTVRVGFIDSGTAESTDGVLFRYTHTVNSGKWEKVSRSNSVETGSVHDTTVTAQISTYSKFTIEVNAAGTSAEFFIDGVSVGTETTNIPTGAGRNTGAGIMFLKSAGTADTGLIDVDGQGIIGYSTTVR